MTAQINQIEIDLSYSLPNNLFSRLDGKVAIVSGASRGIGRACALKLANQGCDVVIAAKSIHPQPTLPGTIHSVAQECRDLGVRALAVQIDMRDVKSLENCVSRTMAEFGRVDILVNNASALWWQDIVDTPVQKFDLIMSINARGTFFLTQFCLKAMAKHDFGRVITMSPAIKTQGFGGYTAYNISKFGMTMTALGVHEEYFLQDKNITGNSLWPATIVESSASINFEMGQRHLWRKPEILADAVVAIVCDGNVSGNMLTDEDFLRSKGLKDQDFVRYRCDPNVEPPRLLVPLSQESIPVSYIKRGNVKALDEDHSKSKL